MAFNRDLLFQIRQVSSDYDGTIKGEYLAKYYQSDDKLYVGKDGQHIRFTFNDFCEVVEIFPLPRTIDERYNDYFQKSYGKLLMSSKNINRVFNIKYHNKLNMEFNPYNSTLLSLYDYNILYSEKSKNKLQSLVLGEELVILLSNLVDAVDNIATEVSTHVHTNVSTPINFRLSSIKNKLQSIKGYMPNILSRNNFVN